MLQQHDDTMTALSIRSLALSLLWLVFSLCLLALYMTVPPSPDQSQFDFMAWMQTRGHPFYAGSFDMNWPGKMVLHEIGIRLFGVHKWTWRLTDFLLLLYITGMGFVFLRNSRFDLAPVIFLFLYPALYVTAGAWMAGQRDLIAAGLLLSASALLLVHIRYLPWHGLIAGILIGCAVMIRPTYLTFLVFGLGVDALWQVGEPLKARFFRALTICLGFCIVLLGFAVYGAWHGSLADWFIQTVLFPLTVYSNHEVRSLVPSLQVTFFSSWHWLTVVGLLGAWLWLSRDRLTKALSFILAMGLTIAISYVVQRKGFAYHLSGYLPLLTLLTVIALDQLFHKAWQTGAMHWRIAAFAIAFLCGAGTMIKMTKMEPVTIAWSGNCDRMAALYRPDTETQELVAIIQGNVPAAGRIFNYGHNFQAVFLAERLPSSRFVNTAAFEQIGPDFPYREEWLSELDAELSERPPDAVIIWMKRLPVSELNEEQTDENRPILKRLKPMLRSDYNLIHAQEDVRIYARLLP